MPHQRGRGRPPHPDVLTPAEWEVLDWLRHGVSRREIARRRRTSIDAVKYHVANIAAKLGVEGGTAGLRLWPGHPATGAATPRTTRKESPMSSTALRLGPIAQVSLYGRDVARAEGFYRDTLGLPHVFTFGDLAFFDMGGVRLYLHAVDDEKWRPGSVLYFLVDDIQAAFEELGRRGVKFSGAPHRIFTDDTTGVEEWLAFFDDSEGNMLAITSRVAPAA
ncbi:MAG TPA: VOC family protein [Candidatus Limnocylindrales bacterium]|nr:VOC family protein [Candidatus Limnocylindrales bacterium]